MSEYVMIFFIVIAGAVALTVFVQRGFEARIHDARDFMIDSLVSSNACDSNCMQAAGGNVYYEYEPYYSLAFSNAQHGGQDSTAATSGNAMVIGAIYTKTLNEDSNTATTSSQLPPCASTSSDMSGCYH